MAKKIKLQGGGEVDPQTYIAQRIQEGTDPQEVVQELAEFNIAEEEAQQLVQQVMSVLGVFQMGGQQGVDAQTQKMQEEIATALQQGAQPQTIIQKLIEMGWPEEEAVAIVTEISNQIQQGAFQMGGEQPDESELLAQIVQALQGGATPEQVIQFLVEEFGFEQGDAEAMVQQIQGTLQRGGKAVCNCCGRPL